MQEHWKAGRDTGRLEDWKGCRKIGGMERMQDHWKAERDAGSFEDLKGCITRQEVIKIWLRIPQTFKFCAV